MRGTIIALTLLLAAAAHADVGCLHPSGLLSDIGTATPPCDGQIVQVDGTDPSVGFGPAAYDATHRRAVPWTAEIARLAALQAATATDKAACADWSVARQWIADIHTHAASIIPQATTLESLTLSGTTAQQLTQILGALHQLGTAIRVTETDADHSATIIGTAGRCVSRDAGGDPNSPGN